MLHITADNLETFVLHVLIALGTPDDLAVIVKDSLVGANLAGHDSHGVIRLPMYADAIHASVTKRATGARGEALLPATRAIVIPAQAMLATVIVDCGWGWGPPAAHVACDQVIARAHQYGIGVTAVQHCNHIMRVGQYVEHIANAGLIGIVFCNSGPGVTPFGGTGRVLGTNPIAIGVPRAGSAPPVFLDGSTSTVAEGKLRVALDKGISVPLGWIIDQQGRPTTQPADFYSGGSILPLGGYKGYAFGVMVELIAGMLSGASAAFLPDYAGGNGVVILALRPDAFVPMPTYLANVERACDALKSVRPEHPQGEVLLPGEPEQRSRADRTAHGIPMAEATVQSLITLARSLNVDATTLNPI